MALREALKHRPETSASSADTDLAELLEACVADGLITRSQMDQIESRAERHRPGRTQHPSRQAVATEALGYVGGVVVLAGALLTAEIYWSQLSVAARLLALGGAAVTLFGAGLAVPQRGDAGRRLRSVLWTATCVAVTAFLGVLGAEALDLGELDVAVVASTGGTATAVALWRAHAHYLVKATVLVGTMATAAATTARLVDSERLPTTAAWLVAAGWLVLAQRRGSRSPVLTGALAAAGAVVTSATILDTAWGLALALGTVGGVVLMAVAGANLALLGVGAAGTLVVVPSLVNVWFPDSDATPPVLLALGLVLVLAALWTARRRQAPSEATTISDRGPLRSVDAAPPAPPQH